MTIRPIICILHGALSTERRSAYERLYAELLPQTQAAGVELFSHIDTAGRGSLQPWLHLLEYAASRDDATHMVVLPDDAILVPHFVEVITRCIEAMPEAVICCQSNHAAAPGAYAAGARWYMTADGFTGFGGAMPLAWVREHLEWRRTALEPTEKVAGDLGVNLWAMATGRPIYKPLPSIVQHDLTLKSLDGNDLPDSPNNKSPRESLVWAPAADLREVNWKDTIAKVGRTYAGNHWKLIWAVRPEYWQIERMYDAARNGPVSEKPHVFIATPIYGEPAAITVKTGPSRRASCEDLASHGYGVTLYEAPGESLVQRMRQRMVHRFLQTEATHLLWWDADVEALDPTSARRLLESGHDVVAGAYPFKDTSKRVVANLWPDQLKTGKVAAERGFVEVQDAGTGFMMVSRESLVKLMMQHPELLHWSLSHADRGQPLWAIYDTAVVHRVYLSEDYYFCHLWQEIGGRVWVDLATELRHWGLYGYEGTMAEQYDLRAEPVDAKEAAE